ncbi:MAG: hypothetical protein FWD73_01255 [Polyangiaceae bacterium]|nr:hypothetical protein [Polyangiaceae bacterium]
MTPHFWSRISAFSSVVFLAIGCNTILGNEEGVLTTPTEPDAATDAAPPTEPDAATPTKPDATASTEPDAATTTEPDEPDAAMPDGGNPEEPGGEADSPSSDDDACALNEQLCGGKCVGLDDPNYGCGQKGCVACAVPHATAACQGTTCIIGACDDGYADCNQSDADGCEADLSQVTSCGDCNVQCTGTTPICTAGQALGTFACTSGCSAEAPGQSPDACGATCDVCPTPANAVALCTNGHCTASCLEGFADCDAIAGNGCEAVLATDPLNCGACGVSCDGVPCVDGTCQVPAADPGNAAPAAPVAPAPAVPLP